MFFIISIWKYHVLLESIMNTLRKHWKEKIHPLKKPAAGAARILKFERKVNNPPLDKGKFDPRRGGLIKGPLEMLF